MTNDEKGGMWQVIYSVSPRTPEGGQAGKGDKPPPSHIPSYCWLPSKGECSDGKKRGVAITRGRQDEGMIFG